MKLWDPHFVFCLSIFFENLLTKIFYENQSSYLILIVLIIKLVGHVEDEEQVCWENLYQEEKE